MRWRRDRLAPASSRADVRARSADSAVAARSEVSGGTNGPFDTTFDDITPRRSPRPEGDVEGEWTDEVAGMVAVLQDLEEVVAFLFTSGGQAPVVDHHHVGAGESGEETGVAAVGAGERQLVEEARGAAVDGAEASAASVLGERAGDVRLPDAGHAGDNHVLVLLHPAAGGEVRVR